MADNIIPYSSRFGVSFLNGGAPDPVSPYIPGLERRESAPAIPFSADREFTTDMMQQYQTPNHTPLDNTRVAIPQKPKPQQPEIKDVKAPELTPAPAQELNNEPHSYGNSVNVPVANALETKKEDAAKVEPEQPKAPPTARPYSNPQAQQQQQQGPYDPHRSLLQTIFGWNDVPYGQKWHHFIQHGFTGMHGNALNEVIAMANTENQAIKNSALGNKSGNTYGQELRAQQMQKTRLRTNLDKLYTEAQRGFHDNTDQSYDSPNGLSKAFNDKIASIRAQLEQMFPNDPEIDTWFRPEYSQLSTRDTFMRKGLKDDADKIRTMDVLADKIESRAENGTLSMADGSLASDLKVVLDAEMPAVAKTVEGSGTGSQADAELQRKQFLLAPDSVQNTINDLFANDLRELTKLIKDAGQSELSADGNELVKQVNTILALPNAKTGYGETADKALGSMDKLVALAGMLMTWNGRSALPAELNTAAQELREYHQEVMRQFQMQGDIDVGKLMELMQAGRDQAYGRRSQQLQQMHLVDNTSSNQNRVYKKGVVAGLKHNVDWLNKIPKPQWTWAKGVHGTVNVPKSNPYQGDKPKGKGKGANMSWAK